MEKIENKNNNDLEYDKTIKARIYYQNYNFIKLKNNNYSNNNYSNNDKTFNVVFKKVTGLKSKKDVVKNSTSKGLNNLINYLSKDRSEEEKEVLKEFNIDSPDLNFTNEKGELLDIKQAKKNISDEWNLKAQKKGSKKFEHFIFSVPKNIDINANILQKSVHETLYKNLSDHKYLIAIHKHDNRYHAHVVIKYLNEETNKAMRLTFAKTKEIRDNFAENLRNNGIHNARSESKEYNSISQENHKGKLKKEHKEWYEKYSELRKSNIEGKALELGEKELNDLFNQFEAPDKSYEDFKDYYDKEPNSAIECIENNPQEFGT